MYIKVWNGNFHDFIPGWPIGKLPYPLWSFLFRFEIPSNQSFWDFLLTYFFEFGTWNNQIFTNSQHVKLQNEHKHTQKKKKKKKPSTLKNKSSANFEIASHCWIVEVVEY